MTGGFLGAHGYDPGPTQRPLLAGAISGLLATIPAVAILAAFGSLDAEAQILGLPDSLTIGCGCLVMAVTGAAYGRLFGRAANDVRGGWLFGMVFGFALWTAGAVLLIPLLSGGRALAGQAAVGAFLSLIGWGATLGVIHPFVHRPLHARLETAMRRMGPQLIGPPARSPARQARSGTPQD